MPGSALGDRNSTLKRMRSNPPGLNDNMAVGRASVVNSYISPEMDGMSEVWRV